MTDLQIHVSDSLEDMGQRFADAWRRAETGERTAERHLSFESFETLARALTPKRLALLRHVHRHSPTSVAELARQIGRDYKRVHEDVEALATAGLIERGETGMRADYDEIRATIAL